jgi:outer membrane protein
MSLFFFRSLPLLLLLVLCGRPADAQQSFSLTPIEQVQYLMAVGLLDDAQDVLARFLTDNPDDIEGNFLKATIAAEQQRWNDAIDTFRRILDEHPDLPRVRLDYARALFAAGEDQEADYNFRLVLPSVEERVASNILRFLNEINARKRLTYSLTLGVSPDTNINAASSLSEITLFGLPFTQSQSSQQKSGVGIIVTTGGEYRQPLRDDFRLRLGGLFYRESYIGHSDFDDMVARVYAGPQYVFADGDASLLGVANKRWYGDDPYSWGYGGRVELNYSISNSVYAQSSIEYTPVGYHLNTFQNGHLLTGLVTTNYALRSTSILSLITGVSEEHDAAPDFSNLSYRIGIGYQRELPAGVTGYLQPDFLVSDYNAESPAFGTTRRDRTVRLQISLSKRDIRLWGFSPSISYTFSQDISNQALFAYTRHQFFFGFANAF